MTGPAPVLAAKNLDASIAFYRSLFKMRVAKQTDQAALLEKDGHRLLLSLNQAPAPEHTVATWSVQKIYDEVARLQEAGIRFRDFGMENRHGVVDMDGDLVTWFNDPSGNLLSLTQWAD